MRYLIILVCVLFFSCAGFKYEVHDEKMNEIRVLEWWWIGNHEINGLAIAKGDTTVTLKSRIADNDELVKLARENLSIVKKLLEAVTP